MGIAYQRTIRETAAQADPRLVPSSMADYAVETISRADATPLILRYEWLRTVGNATHFVGLVSPRRDLEGVACFGWGPNGAPIRERIGEPAWCLERGACVHYAPRNAASYLINRACRLMCRVTGVPIYYAYADPMAGEYGGVYQAAGWRYLGQGLWGKQGYRTKRVFVLAPGADPNNNAAWKTTRELRQKKKTILADLAARNLAIVRHDNGEVHWFACARAVGWRIAERAAKHVYATNVGRERGRWLKQHQGLPYPAPDPERKRRLLADGEPLRIASPDPAPDLFRCDFFEMGVDNLL